MQPLGGYPYPLMNWSHPWLDDITKNRFLTGATKPKNYQGEKNEKTTQGLKTQIQKTLQTYRKKSAQKKYQRKRDARGF